MPLGQYTYHYGHCYNVHHHNGGPTQYGGHICPQLLRSLQQCTPSHRRSSQIAATAHAPRLCLKIEYKSDHRASLILSHTSCLSPSSERRPSFTLYPINHRSAHLSISKRSVVKIEETNVQVFNLTDRTDVLRTQLATFKRTHESRHQFGIEFF